MIKALKTVASKVVKFVWWAGLLLLGFVSGGFAWLQSPLSMTSDNVELAIEPGTSSRAVGQAIADAGVNTSPLLFYTWFRLSGQSRLIRAGNYEIGRGDTPWTLTEKLVRGQETLRSVTLVEGWTFRQMMSALAKADGLRSDTHGLSPEQIMQKLGRGDLSAEGRFFPDTYTYARGSSDLAVLKRASHAMEKQIAEIWKSRAPDTPLKTSDEALTLASIVEKETGRSSDRPQIAGVFVNRLRVGMLLQTDPTVIYGLGPQFDGNLRKRDLQSDSPWNTYVHAGLPPTPIAMPGKEALVAAVRPAQTKALYFVARGDGSSQFSNTLEEHNRAVAHFQRKQ